MTVMPSHGFFSIRSFSTAARKIFLAAIRIFFCVSFAREEQESIISRMSSGFTAASSMAPIAGQICVLILVRYLSRVDAFMPAVLSLYQVAAYSYTCRPDGGT